MNIKKIRLNKIKMQNFKLNKVIEVAFNKDLTEVIGGNNEGKSTIADAIAFVFLGTNQWGDSKFDAINNNNQVATVTLDFNEISSDNRGINYTIKRRQELKGKSKSNAVFINNKEVAISKFNKMFDKDLFLSIINPLYFDSLSPSKGKDILYGLLKVSPEKVLSRLEEDTKELIDYLPEINYELAVEEKSIIRKKISTKEDLINVNRNNITFVTRHIDGLDEQRSNYERLLEELIDNDSYYGSDVSISDIIQDFEDNILNKKDMEKAISKLIESREIRKSISNIKEDIDDSQDLVSHYYNVIKLYEDEIKELKDVTKALDVFMNEELYLINEGIKKHLDKASLEIIDDNGKYVFNRKYNNKVLNTTSNSEQINFGLEFSKALNKLSEYHLPIFVDNAESTHNINSDNLNGQQVITLSVVPKLPLSIVSGVQDDIVVNIDTLETMPRKNIKTDFIHRVISTKDVF